MSFRYILGKDSSSICSQGSGVRTSKPDRVGANPSISQSTQSAHIRPSSHWGSALAAQTIFLFFFYSFAPSNFICPSRTLYRLCTIFSSSYHLPSSCQRSYLLHRSSESGSLQGQTTVRKKNSIAGRNTEGCVLWAQIPVVKLIRDYP